MASILASLIHSFLHFESILQISILRPNESRMEQYKYKGKINFEEDFWTEVAESNFVVLALLDLL
jgi:hypothetical protein